MREHFERRPSAAVLVAIACLALAPDGAFGQAGTRTTPDGKQILISKDIGSERWAISMNLNEDTVTGNVFRADGSPPQFVWCDRLGDDGEEPAQATLRLSCRGADRCDASPCLATAWTELGEVALPGSFFLPATDPFAPLRTSDHFCDPNGIGFEDLAGEPSFKVESGSCNYVTVVQPSMTNIEPGDEVLIRMWHFALTAPSGGEAYIAIQIGERMFWQARLPIPCRGGLVGFAAGDCSDNPIPAEVDPTPFTADFAVPAGAPVYFHLQNHGENGYNLIEITIAGNRTLVTPLGWERVSEGLPLLPPFAR